MKTLALLVPWLIVANVCAESWTPSEELVRAVRRIESGNGRWTVGDGGRSLGDYQISHAAWLDVNAWRKARALPVYRYEKYVWSEPVSRTYAVDYLKILRAQLEKRLERAPTSAELYAAYNMGLTSFAKRQFRLGTTKNSARVRLETALLSR